MSTSPWRAAAWLLARPDLRHSAFTVVDSRDPARVSVRIHETTQKGGEWSPLQVVDALTEALAALLEKLR